MDIKSGDHSVKIEKALFDSVWEKLFLASSKRKSKVTKTELQWEFWIYQEHGEAQHSERWNELSKSDFLGTSKLKWTGIGQF